MSLISLLCGKYYVASDWSGLVSSTLSSFVFLIFRYWLCKDVADWLKDIPGYKGGHVYQSTCSISEITKFILIKFYWGVGKGRRLYIESILENLILTFIGHSNKIKLKSNTLYFKKYQYVNYQDVKFSHRTH